MSNEDRDIVIDLKRELIVDENRMELDIDDDEDDDDDDVEEEEEGALVIDEHLDNRQVQDLVETTPAHQTTLTNTQDAEEEDEEEGQVALDRLPRPVNELNCRQARTYLVKLLRTANGGMNPHYGNQDMKPPFWPDYYWPWEKLTDVHTKPRGMNEPLQYSEMMKLAIARGYQYFGYDPNTYFDAEVEQDKNVPAAKPQVVLNTETDQPSNASVVAKPVFEQPPPRLPRPLSKLNCVQSRTNLARLLRYQQAGNNPVYGSPETRPPWWPDEMIRWVDMVDLRGKPPYLPDSKTYTDVLKQAILNAYKYYGYDSETYLETTPEATGLVEEKQKAYPVIKRTIGQPLPPVPSLLVLAPQPQIPSPTIQPVVPTPQIVAQLTPIPINQLAAHVVTNPEVIAQTHDVNGDEDDDDDEDSENLPPKLPMPIGKMNCSMTRTVLAKLIRFHCGNQLPNYGNPASMPCWWPNHLIDWMQIKNLSHRYEGYLGNTYSNCLRIAVIRGYAHYGLDANEYVEQTNGRQVLGGSSNNNSIGMMMSHQSDENFIIEPMIYLDDDSQDSVEETIVTIPGSPVTSNPIMVDLIPGAQPKVHKRPLPPLVPIPLEADEPELIVPKPKQTGKYKKYPQGMLRRYHWFPPKLRLPSAIVDDEDLQKLKQCKIIADRTCVDNHLFTDQGTTLVHEKPKTLLDFIRNDLIEQKFTDLILKSDAKGGKIFKVHKLVLAAHSSKLKRILQHLSDGGDDPSLIISGTDDSVLETIVQALYTGQVILHGRDHLKTFEASLECLQSLGILLKLRPSMMVQTSEKTFEPLMKASEAAEVAPVSAVDSETLKVHKKVVELVVTMDAEDILDVENEGKFKDESEWEMLSFGKPGPRRSKRIPIPRRFSSGSEHEESEAEPAKATLQNESKENVDDTKPLRAKRAKARRSDQTGSNPEAKSDSQDDSEKNPEDKKRKEEEILQAIKTSPRLRQKAVSKLGQSGQPETPKKSPKTKASIEPPKPVDPVETSPKRGPKPKQVKPKIPETIVVPSGGGTLSRPQRKRESPLKPLHSPERKRSRRASGSTDGQHLEEANAPNFDLVNEDMLKAKVKDGHLEFVRWLMEAKFLHSSPPTCCSKDAQTILTLDTSSPDGVSWKCPNCGHGQSVRSRSIFAKSTDESLCWIMRLILCWSDNTSLMLCQQSTGADVEKIFVWYDFCREYYGRCGRNN